MDENLRRGMILGIAVFVVLVLLSSIVIVPAGHRGVIVTFGKVSDTIWDEGLHIKIPVAQVVKKMSVKIEKDRLSARAATKDLQYIETGVIVNWKLDPAEVNKLYQTIGDKESIVVKILQPAVEEVVKASTARRNAEKILVEREELKIEIEEKLSERLKKNDILLEALSLTNFEFSAEFNKAIEEKQIAEQEAKKAGYIAQKAKQEAEAIINRAKGEAKAKEMLNKVTTKRILALEFYKKWDGKLPSIYSAGKDGAQLLIPVKDAMNAK